MDLFQQAKLGFVLDGLEVLRRMKTGDVVAFCNYWLVADELHILNVAVHPDERRRGHAACFSS